jgi:hypothetical protein
LTGLAEPNSEEEPNSEVWFGLGRIAEQYGEADASHSMYERVEKPKTAAIHPSATYLLAQQRLAALQSPPAAGSKAAGQ